MHTDVIVVTKDNIIIVDGVALVFNFIAPSNIHAIQWHDGVGEIEYINGANKRFNSDCYADDVAPFVALWEAEKTRIETEQVNADAEALALYNSTDACAERIRNERDRRITSCDWVISRHAEQVALSMETSLTADDYAAWLAYRQALRDLPLQDGFPWFGGGADDETCPWPNEPVGNAEVE